MGLVSPNDAIPSQQEPKRAAVLGRLAFLLTSLRPFNRLLRDPGTEACTQHRLYGQHNRPTFKPSSRHHFKPFDLKDIRLLIPAHDKTMGQCLIEF